ncbi:MAG TPA: 6-phosphogluconolactonase [Patescibacteria group bacterium]|nr:6-phosphogluconolactonase [Patescibacteria group bacterium]
MSNIIFRKISSSAPVEKYIADVISPLLESGKKVLWLLPGGSAIKVAVAISKSLPAAHISNLTLTLTDERYGPPGHTDSNWPQLVDAGFRVGTATTQPVLVGKDLQQTVDEFAHTLEKDFEEADFRIALVGMGPDGHIAGIKPGSSAVGSSKLAVGYKWQDFTRITSTINALKKLDEVVIYAIGKEKWPQWDALDKTLDPNVQPAQLLKTLRKVIIYNDYKGDEA